MFEDEVVAMMLMVAFLSRPGVWFRIPLGQGHCRWASLGPCAFRAGRDVSTVK